MRYESGRQTWIRWSIGIGLIVVALIAGSVAFVSYQRNRGGDELIRLLDELGAEYEFQYGKTKEPNQSSWAAFLGTSTQPVMRISITDTELDATTAKRLAINRAAREVRELRLTNVTALEDAPLFFRNWRPVQRLVIDSCSIPDSWWGDLEDVRGLRYLDVNNVRAKWMYGDGGFLRNVERIRFQDCELTSLQLAAIRKSSRKSKLEVLATPMTPDEVADFPPTVSNSTEGISQRNPQAEAAMKAVFSKLEQAMRDLDPPATNQFNPPATLDQIALLEQTLKIPLPAELIAYLECHNGQPDDSEKLISGQRLLPVDRMLEEYVKFQVRNHGKGRPGFFDFKPNILSLENPNLLPIAASEGHIVSYNLVGGNLTRYDPDAAGADGSTMERYAPTLKEYLNAIVAQIEAGEFRRYNDSQHQKDAIVVEGWQR